MELMWLGVAIVVAAVIISLFPKMEKTPPVQARKFLYSRKESLMTAAETKFFHRLQSVAGDRYYIFPQIHLSALLKNETKGKYWKAAFQRINHKSVDYVLAHKETLQVVYAVELDDWSHDSNKRKARDADVETMLAEAHIPLVRFRDVGAMSDDAIAQRFYEASLLD